MIIDSDEWVPSAEAARLLTVSRQRVLQMADEEGALDWIRPWPQVTLIGRTSIAEWLAGKRLPPLQTAEVRRFVLARTGADTVRDLDLDTVHEFTRTFIEEARPRMSDRHKDLWAVNTAERLRRSRLAV